MRTPKQSSRHVYPAMAALGAGILFLGLGGRAATPPGSSAHGIRKSPIHLHLRISRRTTYLTAPVGVNGTVDYLAAINARESRGVTDKNNAARVTIKIVSPGAYKNIRAPLLAALHITRPLNPNTVHLRNYREAKTPVSAEFRLFAEGNPA